MPKTMKPQDYLPGAMTARVPQRRQRREPPYDAVKFFSGFTEDQKAALEENNAALLGVIDEAKEGGFKFSEESAKDQNDKTVAANAQKAEVD